MSVCHRFCFILSVLTVVAVGCGGPRSTAPQESLSGPALNWENLDSFDFNAVTAEPDLIIPARHLYERIYFSRVASAGGWVEDSTIEFFRDSLLVDTLLGLNAADFDLTSQWYLYRDYRRRVETVLAKNFWDKNVSSQIDIDSQKVIDFYEEHPENFELPEQANIYHILVSFLGFLQSPDSALYRGWDRQDLRDFTGEYVQQLHQLLMAGEAFENVAFNYSHDVLSREKGGHLGWTVREKYLDPFDSVAFSLANGEFSEPYLDADGWHILYKTDYNPGGTQPLSTQWVYTRAQQSVFDAEASRMAAGIMTDLEGDTRIVENQRVLTDTNLYDFADSVWVAIVNETDTVFVQDIKPYEDQYRRVYQIGNTSPELRSVMIKQATMPVRVLIAARDQGLDTLPDYRELTARTWREASKSYLISEMYAREDWAPSDSAIEQYYQEHFDDYNPKNHIKAQILIADDVELANFLKDQIGLGLDLEYLSRYYGAEEGYNVKFKDLGIVAEDKVEPELYHAFALTHAMGATSVVETKEGFVVGKVLDRDYARPLPMVKSEISSILIERHRWQRWSDRRDELFEKHQVRFPGTLPRFELPRLSERNHPRTLPKPVTFGPF